MNFKSKVTAPVEVEQSKTLSTISVEGYNEPVIDLVSNPIEGRQIAIVDFGTILKLARLLPSANLYEIKQQLINGLDNTETIEQYVFVLSEEIAFHKTVNLLQAESFTFEKVN